MGVHHSAVCHFGMQSTAVAHAARLSKHVNGLPALLVTDTAPCEKLYSAGRFPTHANACGMLFGAADDNGDAKYGDNGNGGRCAVRISPERDVVRRGRGFAAVDPRAEGRRRTTGSAATASSGRREPSDSAAAARSDATLVARPCNVLHRSATCGNAAAAHVALRNDFSAPALQHRAPAAQHRALRCNLVLLRRNPGVFS
jgi:hypothetical protein